MEIIVVRYGHRDVRDYRVTSHCALVARALGASKIIICGTREEAVENTIKGVNERWGGKFMVEFAPTWEKTLRDLKKKKYKIAHLTMYGLPLQEVEETLSKEKKIAVIIGSQKVERGVYEMSNFNIGVTNQPHSEIAAMAVFLDRVQKGKELEKEFKHAKKQIIPQENGKRVIALK